MNASEAQFRPLVQAALQTGCRYGGLHALKAQDFNPESGTIHIRTSKGGKARHVILTARGGQAVQAADRWARARRADSAT
jgi:integrase